MAGGQCRDLDWCIAVLFALIFKLLPDVSISWRESFVGGVFTSVLFGAEFTRAYVMRSRQPLETLKRPIVSGPPDSGLY